MRISRKRMRSWKIRKKRMRGGGEEGTSGRGRRVEGGSVVGRGGLRYFTPPQFFQLCK